MSGPCLVNKLAIVSVQIARLIARFGKLGVEEALVKAVSSERAARKASGEEAESFKVKKPLARGPWSWNDVRQELIPPYVEAVSFSVSPGDLSVERQEDLKTRFPSVSIVSNAASSDHIKSNAKLDTAQDQPQTPIKNGARIDSPVTVKGPSVLGITTRPVAETVPTTPLPAVDNTPKPRFVSTLSLIDSERNPSKDSDAANTPMASKQHPLLDIADQIGMDISGSERVLRSMWFHWQKSRIVRPFNEVPKTSLERFYNNLVRCYILAHHAGESALCFTILLRLQNTNYTYRDELPSVPAAVLAFQFLPEDNGLCEWIATLLAFLWGTQQWRNRAHLLADFPEIDKDAFCKFIFAIARIRDPFTKGHNTAALAQWCEVHSHAEGSAEEAQCKAVHGEMKAELDKITDEEARQECEEARRIVSEYDGRVRAGRKSGGVGVGVGVLSGTPSSSKVTPTSSRKRRVEISSSYSLRRTKKGKGTGGDGRA